MIDLNKVRSIRALEGMKKDLTEFATFDRAIMVQVYDEQYGWGEEDYEADLDQVKEMLEKVERRINSLSNYLNKQKVKVDKKKHGQSGASESPTASQSA